MCQGNRVETLNSQLVVKSSLEIFISVFVESMIMLKIYLTDLGKLSKIRQCEKDVKQKRQNIESKVKYNLKKNLNVRKCYEVSTLT